MLPIDYDSLCEPEWQFFRMVESMLERPLNIADPSRLAAWFERNRQYEDHPLYKGISALLDIIMANGDPSPLDLGSLRSALVVTIGEKQSSRYITTRNEKSAFADDMISGAMSLKTPHGALMADNQYAPTSQSGHVAGAPAKRRFAAIDFETSHYSRHCACSFGIAVVEDGQVVETVGGLIKPPNSRIMFTEYHGLVWADLADQPPFPDSAHQKISAVCENIEFLVAHNASFDHSVLRQCCDYYDLPFPVVPWRCTLKSARQSASLTLEKYKLPQVCAALGIPLNAHHQANDDALACARIAIHFMRGLELLPYEPAPRKSGIKTQGDHSRATSYRVDRDPDDLSVKGRRFCLTGTLESMARAEAYALIESRGAKHVSAVSAITDFLVVGDNVLADFTNSGKATGKLKAAAQFNTEGRNIEIIGESEFLQMFE